MKVHMLQRIVLAVAVWAPMTALAQIPPTKYFGVDLMNPCRAATKLPQCELVPKASTPAASAADTWQVQPWAVPNSPEKVLGRPLRDEDYWVLVPGMKPPKPIDLDNYKPPDLCKVYPNLGKCEQLSFQAFDYGLTKYCRTNPTSKGCIDLSAATGIGDITPFATTSGVPEICPRFPDLPECKLRKDQIKRIEDTCRMLPGLAYCRQRER